MDGGDMKGSCQHENLRSFKFSDGQIINKCDCKAFDTARARVLAPDSIKQPWNKPEAETGYTVVAARREVKILVEDVPGYLESLADLEIEEPETETEVEELTETE